ncbi:ATP-dependent DNA helicase II subunit 1 [Xanthoria calcicola]
MAENKWKPPGDDEEDEEEVDETAYKTVKDAVLFVIEVSSSMLTPPPPTDSKKADTDSPTSAALKCAYALMQQRIISNPNDMMGVLLYGTEKSKFNSENDATGNLSYPHCYLLSDLDIPAAEDVKALKTLVEDEDEFRKLLVPSKETVSMANVLFCANQIFTTKAPNFSSRRLFIVTDNDDPHAAEKAAKSSAAVRAKDLYDLGVLIELFPISRPDQEFDKRKFYDDIVYSQISTDPEAPAPISGPVKASSTGDGISLLNSLLSNINSKAVARRALFSNLPLEVGPGFKISVKGFIIFKRQDPKRSCYVYLAGEKAQIATGVTTEVASDTARTVEKVEIKKAYRFGGEQILFTPEEISSLRNFGEPCIRILGFKPISMLPIWANLKPATFIYPSEEDYIGSTRVFAALHAKLLASQKMGITWFIARKNAAPVLAALYPGPESLDENGMQTLPPGLWLIPLPYADDIRQNPEITTLIRAPEPLIDRMRLVIQQLQLPKAKYDPCKYPNPSLQWHYRILQAMALGEDLPEMPEDKTVPRYRQIHKRAGEYVLDWGRELHAQHEAWLKENSLSSSLLMGTRSVGAKRAAAAAGGEGEREAAGRKRAKVEEVDDAGMQKAYADDKVGKLTVAVLRAWLEGKGMDGKGKKGELVDRVTRFFEAK